MKEHDFPRYTVNIPVVFRSAFFGTFVCALGIAALIGAASGLVIPVTADAAEVTVTVNPYATVDWDHVNHYKVNLHTHTTESDGRMPPSQVIDEYHTRGYHGLAITDHNLVTWPWTDYDRNPASLNMLAIPGNELSRHHHTLSLFTDYKTESTDHDEALTGVANAGGMAILCHPAMHWLREYQSAPCLQIPIAPPLRSITQGDFTVEAWFRTTHTDRNVLMGNFSSGYQGALNLELHTHNRVRLFVQPAGNGKTVDVTMRADELGINTRDGQWHHLAGIRRGDAVCVYLDGRLAMKRDDRAGAFDLQGSYYYIGRDTRTSDVTFKGSLARVRLWRRAFTEAEATAAGASAPLTQEGLLAAYTFATGDGRNTATDGAGSLDGAVLGSVKKEVVATPPAAMRTSEKPVSAMAFGEGEFPVVVPDAAVDNFVSLFKRHACLKAVEIHNRTRPVREHPLDRNLWDRLLSALMPGRPVWGAAVDDMHSMEHLGENWMVLLGDSLNEKTARNALETGRYYFASTRLHEPDNNAVEGTPRIDNITHDPEAGSITVVATVGGTAVPDNNYVWISDGKPVHTGPVFHYRDVAGLGAYVRVEITGSGGTAYANPFGFLKS